MCVGSAGSRADGRAGRRGSRQSRTGAWRRRGARACSDRARSTSHRAATWRSCGSWSEAPAWCAVALARSQVRFDAADRSRKSRKSPLGSEFCGDIPFTLWLFSERPDQKGPGFLRSEAMLRGELQTEAKRFTAVNFVTWRLRFAHQRDVCNDFTLRACNGSGPCRIADGSTSRVGGVPMVFARVWLQSGGVACRPNRKASVLMRDGHRLTSGRGSQPLLACVNQLRSSYWLKKRMTNRRIDRGTSR